MMEVYTGVTLFGSLRGVADHIARMGKILPRLQAS